LKASEPSGLIHNYISPGAIIDLREAISEAQGCEVFAVGRLDRDFIVEEVSVLACGNMGAAPVVDPTLIRGQVVIHNHPSGNLMPSDADIAAASALAKRGIGFWIIDNAVERLRSVTDPLSNDRGCIVVDPADIDHLFSSTGPFARSFGGYERREGQVRMAKAVGAALSDSACLIVEAGTGTGKSLAYLVPALLWARRNSKRVVVSTNTINLQEQLVYKDIPTLARVMGEPIRAVLVKGRSNYLCLRKLDRTLSGQDHMVGADQREAFAALVAWSMETETGDRSELAWEPDPDVWDLVCSDGDMCLRSHCQRFSSCHFHRARRAMEGAEILVTNHHLLFADISIRRERGAEAERAVLPRYSAAILDEAHNAAGVAQEYFGRSVSRASLVRLTNAIFRRERPRGERGTTELGALVSLRGRVLSADWMDRNTTDALMDAIDMDVIPGVLRAREAGEVFFETVGDLMQGRGTQDGQDRVLRITADVKSEDAWDRHVWPAHERFCAALDDLARDVRSLSERVSLEEDEDFRSSALELGAFSNRLSGMADSTRFVIRADTPGHVYWAEARGRKGGVRIVATPLSVSEQMAAFLIEPQDATVFTSATLAVGSSFEFVGEDLGLSRVPSETVRELVVPSPFDFMRQALLCVTTDIPPPDSPGYPEAATAALGEIIRASKGRAFALFTSYKFMEVASRALQPVARNLGFRLLKQGDAPRHSLLEQFRKDVGSVLLGTDSFWEGVDVPGEALSCVIITRLPFGVPTDPVIQAKLEEIEGAGGNPFARYSLPAAVLKFKQGFGRLIRTSHDRGAVVILDSRLATRPYGRSFLEALPRCAREFGPTAEVARAVQTWLAECGA
jgi:ATP-dependent DNA helicase DinG